MTDPQTGQRPGRKDIEVILFDVGGVLVVDMIESKLRDLGARHNLTPERLLSIKDLWRLKADLGEISDQTFWEGILRDAGVEPAPADAEIDSYMALVPGSLELARELSALYRVAILSNDSKEMSRLRRLRFGLDQIFDPVLISAEIGLVKPDQAVYRRALERLGVAPAQVLFVDNSTDNVAAARQAGMQAICFESAAQLRKELARRGLLP